MAAAGDKCLTCGSEAGFFQPEVPAPSDTAPSAGAPVEAPDPASSGAGRRPARKKVKFAAEPYEVQRTLGVGGVGVVYLARDKTSDQLVAIKALRSSLRKNAEIIARFRREVEIAKKLEHPNIARLHSLNETPEHLFIVMDYIDGVDLGDFVKRNKPSLGVKLKIMKSVCAAIEAAHELGVTHRDMKPGNILIDQDSVPHVLDFGVASFDDDASVTRPGSFIGTPLYVSPEQAEGKRVDHRADIYSLGAIFYEMVTGRPPFIGDSAITIALKHIREKPFKPRSVDPTIPKLIEDVILRCLEKDPASRPQRASDIVRDIERPIEKELAAARQAAKAGRAVVQEAGSGDLQDISLFQYLRMVTPIKRNFVLEIVDNEEFGRYHFRSAHLVHGEAGNLRDQEVAYNLFYWSRGIYRLIDDPEPPARETVSVPWVPYVENCQEQFQQTLLGVHGVLEGPIILDILDPRGTSLIRYVSDAAFAHSVGDRAKMTMAAFQTGRKHLENRDLRKIAKTSDDAAMMFAFFPGLRHHMYALMRPDVDVEVLYHWLKSKVEPQLVLALHDCMVEVDTKRKSRRGPVKVLVAESEAFLGNVVRIKLRSMDMEVILVRTGEKVLEVVPQYNPDIVLLNVNLAGVSGYDVCRSLAESKRTGQIPIVLLTPSEQKSGADDIWPPGVVRVLGKPIVLDELVEVVERYSTRRRDRRSAA